MKHSTKNKFEVIFMLLGLISAVLLFSLILSNTPNIWDSMVRGSDEFSITFTKLIFRDHFNYVLVLCLSGMGSCFYYFKKQWQPV